MIGSDYCIANGELIKNEMIQYSPSNYHGYKLSEDEYDKYDEDRISVWGNFYYESSDGVNLKVFDGDFKKALSTYLKCYRKYQTAIINHDYHDETRYAYSYEFKINGDIKTYVLTSIFNIYESGKYSVEPSDFKYNFYVFDNISKDPTLFEKIPENITSIDMLEPHYKIVAIMIHHEGFEFNNGK
jgi:hypothetical protein